MTPPMSSRAPREPLLPLAARLAALVAGVSVAVRAAVDPDLWGHLKFGLDLLHSRRLSYVEAYSFTQDTIWINHEWLSELAFAAAYQAGGVAGMLLLKAAILGAAFVTLAWLTRGMREEVRGWLLAAAFVALAPAAITFRPQLWTVLAVPLLCGMLDGRIRLIFMPLLFAVWANLHGGWLVGGGIGTLWLLGRALDTRAWRPLVPTFVALAASALATLVNPYGWRLWTFLFTTVRLSRPDITEWRPYWEAFAPTHLVLWPLTVGFLCATILTRWRSLRWAMLLPAIWLTLNGLTVSRLAPLAALVVAWCVAGAWRAGDPDPGESSGGIDSFNRLHAGAASRRIVDAVMLAAVALPLLVAQSRCLPLTDKWLPDPVTASALSTPGLKGRLLLPFDWGEYAIWHWGPRLQVSIDGRRETIYSQHAIDRQIAMVDATPTGLAHLAVLRPEYAWVTGSTESALGRWLSGNGYRIDVASAKAFVAVRSDLPPIAAGPAPAACFP